MWRVLAVAALATGLVCPPPCGPFCPMRSSECVLPSLDRKLEVLGASAPLITEQLAALTSELEEQGPSEPFAKRCDTLGGDLRALREDYAAAQETLRASDDFQALEYAAFTDEARARSSGGGLSAAEADAIVDFQVALMKAIGENSPPPMPPAGLDLNKLEAMDDDLTLLLAPAGARVTASPLRTAAATQQLPDAVGEVLADLMDDHQNLVELGAGFGAFDHFGRAMYLDKLDDVEKRWKDFLESHGPDLSSASLLATDYLEQTDAFLKGVGLGSIEEYLEVLDGAHRRMRQELA